MAEEKNGKKPTGFRVDDHMMTQIKMLMPVDGSKSFQEFCERAVKFYVSYLSAEDHESYVTSMLRDTLRGMFYQFELDMNRSNSKMTIAMEELLMAMAYTHEYPKDDLRQIRGRAAKIAKENDGPVSLERSQRELYSMFSDGSDDSFQD